RDARRWSQEDGRLGVSATGHVLTNQELARRRAHLVVGRREATAWIADADDARPAISLPQFVDELVARYIAEGQRGLAMQGDDELADLAIGHLPQQQIAVHAR